MELKAVREKKLAICSSCENYKKIIKTCNICKCVMPLKVFIKGNTCPIGKHEI